MPIVNPYLNFNGKTEEAFNFYKSVFGGEFSALQRFKEMPDASEMTEEDGNKIMHVSLPIGHGTILMATDTLESMGQTLTEGNNFSIAVSTGSESEADKFFNGLSAGGKTVIPMEKAFWGDYFGILVDPYGIQWMITFNEKYPM